MATNSRSLPTPPDVTAFIQQCTAWLEAERDRIDSLLAQLSGAARARATDTLPVLSLAPDFEVNGRTRADVIDAVLENAGDWVTVRQVSEALLASGNLDDYPRLADCKVRLVLKRSHAKYGWETTKRAGARLWRKAPACAGGPA